MSEWTSKIEVKEGKEKILEKAENIIEKWKLKMPSVFPPLIFVYV